jgi:hypothetical protein
MKKKNPIKDQLAFQFYRDLRPEDEIIFHFAELLKKKAQSFVTNEMSKIKIAETINENEFCYIYLKTIIYQISEEKIESPDAVKLFVRKISNNAYLSDFTEKLLGFNEGKSIIDEAHFDFYTSTNSVSIDDFSELCRQHGSIMYSIEEIFNETNLNAIKKQIGTKKLIIFFDNKISFNNSDFDSSAYIDSIVKDRDIGISKLKQIALDNKWLLVSCFPDFKDERSLIFDLNDLKLFDNIKKTNELLKLFDNEDINIYGETNISETIKETVMVDKLNKLLKKFDYRIIFDNDFLLLNNSDTIHDNNHNTINWDSVILSPKQLIPPFRQLQETYFYTKINETSKFFRNEISGCVCSLEELLNISKVTIEIQKQNER